mmetsp:Transcript_81996/g.228544  ORF Transcript_81996/g.228544 Transcript_81996/m.228544 type:complete len:202 (-) Transcript_81996:235-840(-)
MSKSNASGKLVGPSCVRTGNSDSAECRNIRAPARKPSSGASSSNFTVPSALPLEASLRNKRCCSSSSVCTMIQCKPAGNVFGLRASMANARATSRSFRKVQISRRSNSQKRPKSAVTHAATNTVVDHGGNRDAATCRGSDVDGATALSGLKASVLVGRGLGADAEVSVAVGSELEGDTAPAATHESWASSASGGGSCVSVC